jgi:hypothetical protein
VREAEALFAPPARCRVGRLKLWFIVFVVFDFDHQDEAIASGIGSLEMKFWLYPAAASLRYCLIKMSKLPWRLSRPPSASVTEGACVLETE